MQTASGPEQRRQQILNAAVACFARKGFHQTTMADIAREAGVSDGLAYRYFSGKEEIIETVVREWNASAADRLLHSADEDVEDFSALVDLLVSSSIHRLEQQPDIAATLSVRFRSWAEALRNEEVRAGVRGRWWHAFDIVERLIGTAQQQGQVAPGLDPRAVARVMLAVYDGLSLQAVLDPEIDLEKCKEVMLAMAAGLHHGDFPPEAKTNKTSDRGGPYG